MNLKFLTQGLLFRNADTTPADYKAMTNDYAYSSRFSRWTKLCILSLPVILILVLVSVAISAPFRANDIGISFGHIGKKQTIVHDDHATCNIQLVESIPDGLNFSTDAPKFLSTYEAWSTLLNLAEESLDIGSFYWTMRGVDVVNHSTAADGEEIFERLLANGKSRKIKIRIAQSLPTEKEPDIDTKILKSADAADVRSVNFTRLLGGGVLHTKLWIVDQKHFYLGSANMDWRSLTQVKEMGVLAQNCSCLAQDLLKIFHAYWYLGVDTAVIPSPWPKEYSTRINSKFPLPITFNEDYKMSVYFSSSPPPFVAEGRTHDLDAILSTISKAENFIHIAVMDYFPLIIYGAKIQFWPYIDDALRKAAVERKVSIKLLISLWPNSRPSEDYFLKSLSSLSHAMKGVDIEIKRFIVPVNDDQSRIPFSRVNHNKYMVTDKTAYIGTSNWSGDYFTNTAGIGFVSDEDKPCNETTEEKRTLRFQLASVFDRDWNSKYAVEM